MSSRSDKILVTGANGFVGSAVLTRLLVDGKDAVGTVRQSSQQGQRALRDLCDPEQVRHAVTGTSVVIHAAAQARADKRGSAGAILQLRRTNVEGTFTLARLAASQGVERFVFISSVKVNGESSAPDTPLTESDPPRPMDDYAWSKHDAEQGLREIASETGLEVVIVRPPLVYGPGVKGNFAVMTAAVRKGWPLPFGAIDNKRSLVALDNLVDFIVHCADRERAPQAANQLFLVSDCQDVSTPEMLRKIARAWQVNAHLPAVPAAWLRLMAKSVGKTAQFDRLLGSLALDVSKARNVMGWKPVVTMDEQLKKMANHVANT